jgi:hypothetical protein
MRTETKTIGIYTFDELSEEAKENVVYWLNMGFFEHPQMTWLFLRIQRDGAKVAEHCEMNGYEFLEDGTIY